MVQYKSVPLEIKDIDSATRTAVIAHAVYNNIDRTKDISRKGMFSKSWAENKGQIRAYVNHDVYASPGKVLDVYEDDNKAYTQIKFGTHTLGNDSLIMCDEGTIQDASFGYQAVKSNEIEVKGQKIRELVEVKHYETSILTCMPANPEAGIVSVTKSFEFVQKAVERLILLEKFIRNTKASDECIIKAAEEAKNIRSILSGLDTADTHDGEPSASDDGEEQVKMAIALLGLKLSA